MRIEPTKSVNVCVTGGAGNIGRFFITSLCSGNVFGDDAMVNLTILDVAGSENRLTGNRMEIDDVPFQCLDTLKTTIDIEDAFKDQDYIVCIGGIPRKQGMERSDLIGKNAQIFKAQGEALKKVGKPTCKVVVVANPANTNAAILSNAAYPTIPRANVTALVMLDHNRLRCEMARRASVRPTQVRNCVYWGNHSPTGFPDVSSSYIICYDSPCPNTPGNSGTCDGSRGSDGRKFTIKNCKDCPKMSGDQASIIKHVQKRGGEVISMLGQSSSISASCAIIDHIKVINGGCPITATSKKCSGTSSCPLLKEDYYSIGVYSDGKSYGVPAGVVFSFPCKPNKTTSAFDIVTGIEMTDCLKSHISANVKELQEELVQATNA